MRFATWLYCMVFLGLVLLLAPVAAAQVIPGVPIGAATVILDYSVVAATGNVSAFIPTGSSSNVCLVTLGDSNIYFTGPSPAICIQRTFQGRNGIVIIVIPYFGTLPADMVLRVTVYQQGAHGYGQPVLYTD